MNGAQYLIRFLKSKGVEISFGYPGGAVLPLYDRIARENFPHILMRHEQGAIHAAEGYAKVTGKTGVVIATSGPGATNLVTGLANAYLDSTPVFAITGQVASNSIGRDSFQEADTTGITTPITKHNYLVKSPDELPNALEHAWNVAISGRKGPVLVDITKDTFTGEIKDVIIKDTVKPKKFSDLSEEVPKVIKFLSESEKPLILAGGGVAGNPEASEKLKALCEKLNIQVVTTLMGKGAVSERAPYSLGVAGMHGLAAANLALDSCDFLLAIGTRFSDRVIGNGEEYAKGRTIVHVDIDRAELGKNIPATLKIAAEADAFLSAMLEDAYDNPKWKVWNEQLEKWKDEYRAHFDTEGPIKPQQIICEVNKYGNIIAVTDVGQNQMFTHQHYKVVEPRSFVTSGGLGTMGFGLPAAIGAAVGAKGKKVALFAGDGGIQMTIQELASLARLRLPVKIFIIDNHCLGMVRQWQELFYGENYSHSILNDNPDFVVLAKAYGIKAVRLEDPNEVEETVSEVMSDNLPCLVHCIVDPRENVLPMIPPGGNPKDMMLKK